MSGFSPWFQLVYGTIAIITFGVIALLTRARARRIAGALASVAVFTAISAPIDTLGLRAGWWSYPSCTNPPHPPLGIYIAQTLYFVGNLALIGWRIDRRFGARGLAALVATVCSVGLVRDLMWATILPTMVRFGAAPAAELADAGAWATVVAVALGVTRVVAGPAKADPPRP